MATHMNPKRNPDWVHLAIAVAIYYSQGMRQVDIAKKLGKGKADVFALLQFAREVGFLSRAPALLRHNINDVLWEETLRKYFQASDITGLLTKIVPDKVEFTAHVMSGSYVDFIHGAAVHVAHLLTGALKLGVMWGRTIYLLVENIKAHGEKVNRDVLGRIECVPLCGDPIYLMNRRWLIYSASWLAWDLENAIRRLAMRRSDFPSLTGVPAYLSRAVRAGAKLDDKNWVNFLNQIPGYKRILGRPPKGRRLAAEVDTIITGVGIIAPNSHSYDPTNPAPPDETSTGDLIEERLQQEGEEVRRKLPDLIYGDIGGVLLSRPGLKPEDRKLVDELSQGWTGLKEDDLRRIASAARRGAAPGIIVVASGAAKAEVVHEAIKRGLVNHLVVDEPLKSKLEELARNCGGSTAAGSSD